MKHIVIIFMLISGNLFAQNYIPYYNLVNEANYRLMITKEYDKAEKLYLDAFKLEKPFERDYYQLARCYAGKGDMTNMIKYLKLSAANPGFNPLPFISLKKDSALFADYQNQESFMNFMSEAKTLKEQQKKTLQNDVDNNAKRDTINYFFKKSTENRKGMSLNKDMTEAQKDSIKRVLDAKNTIVREALLKYIEQNGFPEFITLNNLLSGSNSLSVILAGMSEDEFEKYNSLFLKEIKKGNLIPYYYGFFASKIQFKNKEDKCSYYLTNKLNKECWEKAIEERKKVGLSNYLDGSPLDIMQGFNKKLPWVGSLVN